MHTAVAISLSGIPLGILSQKLWPRENEKRIHPGYREPEDRESKKWFECLEETINLVPDPNNVITVTDREGDIYEFLFRMRGLQSHFLIRANWNRVIRKEDCVTSLWNQADTQPISGEYEVEVTETKGKEVKTRKAKIGVRFDSMKILPDAPCSVAFEEHEWKALYYKTHRKLPKGTPAMGEMVRCLAKLGGFLGRKGDDYPGIKSIWRGWERPTDIAEGWLLASGTATCG